MATGAQVERMSLSMVTTSLIATNGHTGIFTFAEGDSGVYSAAIFTKSEDGSSATIENWPVFKAGTFADSWGYVETWSVEHLAQMVSNFNMLRGPLPNIPVRADHGRSINGVKGYITDLRTEGGFLFASAELTEPDAVEKWERGTYRSRSAEIGFYETNEGAAYFPVFLGVAFVDIPAVEGLFSRETSGDDKIHYFTEATPSMPTTNSTQANDTAPAIQRLDSDSGNQNPASFTVNLVATPTAGPGDQATPTAPQFFTFGDEKISVDKIQEHLDTMAEFQRQQMQVARASFASELVKTNRFGAPQETVLAAFFGSLTVEQFTKAQELFSGAPELSLLATHGDGITNAGNDKHTLSERDREIAKHEGVLKQHTRAGMKPAQIEQTESFKALQRLKAQSN